jgi:hypothetical protein
MGRWLAVGVRARRADGGLDYIYSDAEQGRATGVGEGCGADGRVDNRGVMVSRRHERSRGCPRQEGDTCGG